MSPDEPHAAPQLTVASIAGKPVVTYDDERLGVARDVVDSSDGRRYVVVTSDLFGTGTYYVPGSEVRRVGETRVLLSITRDDLRELDWLKAPPGIDPA